MKQLTLRLPDELYEQVRREAERKAMPISDLVNIILYSHYRSVEQE